MKYELAPLFRAVETMLCQNRGVLNQADLDNSNHGDHMVEVFQLATQAAEEKREAELAEAMAYAGRLLQEQTHNGSAQMYAHGLAQMAEQFRNHHVTLEDLVAEVRGALVENREKQAGAEGSLSRPGEVLKALMAGLVCWGQVESGHSPEDIPLDVGVLFEFGMAYLQAKQRSGNRIEVLADAAASVSPLREVPHRYDSGKMAIQALLRAMQADMTGLPDEM